MKNAVTCNALYFLVCPTDVSVPRNLQKTVGDKSQLRYLTGEWFYETKQLRHQEHIHGSDIIRASLRHTQKPLTLCESVTFCISSVFLS